MLVFAVLFLPVGVVINIIFRREIHVDLKLAIIINAVFALSWYVITFVSTFLDMRKLERIGAARMPSFPATALVAGLYGVVGIGSLWLMMGLHKEADPLWVQLLPLAGVALAFCAWPRTHPLREDVSLTTQPLGPQEGHSLCRGRGHLRWAPGYDDCAGCWIHN